MAVPGKPAPFKDATLMATPPPRGASLGASAIALALTALEDFAAALGPLGVPTAKHRPITRLAWETARQGSPPEGGGDVAAWALLEAEEAALTEIGAIAIAGALEAEAAREGRPSAMPRSPRRSPRAGPGPWAWLCWRVDACARAAAFAGVEPQRCAELRRLGTRLLEPWRAALAGMAAPPPPEGDEGGSGAPDAGGSGGVTTDSPKATDALTEPEKAAEAHESPGSQEPAQAHEQDSLPNASANGEIEPTSTIDHEAKKSVFDAIDRNHDDVITRDEFQHFQDARRAKAQAFVRRASFGGGSISQLWLAAPSAASHGAAARDAWRGPMMAREVLDAVRKGEVGIDWLVCGLTAPLPDEPVSSESAIPIWEAMATLGQAARKDGEVRVQKRLDSHMLANTAQ